MMPSEIHFTKMMRSINVGKNDLVVIYDKYRNISAPRTHFMMKCFGLPYVWVLNGTFSKWESEKKLIESGDNDGAFTKIMLTHSDEDFNFKLNSAKIRQFEDIDRIVKLKQDGDAS